MNDGVFARYRRVFVAAMATVAIVLGLVLTPAGAALGQLLTVFRAEQFAAVTIDPQSLQNVEPGALADMGPEDFGSFAGTQPKTIDLTSPAEAQARVDFPVRTLAGLSGAPAKVGVSTPASATFTFDLEKTRTSLAEIGVRATLPAEFDGATVEVDIPAMVGQFWGSEETGIFFLQGRSPTLEIAPVLDTPEMWDLFFTLSGLPPELESQVRAFTAARDTVPVPVMEGDDAREVDVDGVKGLLVNYRGRGGAENTVSFLLWQKDGIVYALGGNVPQAEILAAAQSLQLVQ